MFIQTGYLWGTPRASDRPKIAGFGKEGETFGEGRCFGDFFWYLYLFDGVVIIYLVVVLAKDLTEILALTVTWLIFCTVVSLPLV